MYDIHINGYIRSYTFIVDCDNAIPVNPKILCKGTQRTHFYISFNCPILRS